MKLVLQGTHLDLDSKYRQKRDKETVYSRTSSPI